VQHLQRASACTDDDRDRDGLTDGDETRIGTNPDNPDTDGTACATARGRPDPQCPATPTATG
jgi:hypothetical protein